MKTPVVCPKCHGPLLNSTLELSNGEELWRKECASKLDHSFTCIVKESDNSIIGVGVTLDRSIPLKVYWDFMRSKIIVHKGVSIVVPFANGSTLEIPWFEPNLDEYDKLVNKIKKYVVFS